MSGHDDGERRPRWRGRRGVALAGGAGLVLAAVAGVRGQGDEFSRHVAEAQRLHDQGQDEGAIAELKQAQKLRDDPKLWLNLGIVYLDWDGHAGKAKEACSTFLKRAPDAAAAARQAAQQCIGDARRELARQHPVVTPPPVVTPAQLRSAPPAVAATATSAVLGDQATPQPVALVLRLRGDWGIKKADRTVEKLKAGDALPAGAVLTGGVNRADMIDLVFATAATGHYTLHCPSADRACRQPLGPAIDPAPDFWTRFWQSLRQAMSAPEFRQSIPEFAAVRGGQYREMAILEEGNEGRELARLAESSWAGAESMTLIPRPPATGTIEIDLARLKDGSVSAPRMAAGIYKATFHRAYQADMGSTWILVIDGRRVEAARKRFGELGRVLNPKGPVPDRAVQLAMLLLLDRDRQGAAR